MFEAALEALEALREAVRPADVVDVLVISVGIYFTLRWLRSRATRAVAVGLASFALLYLAARRTDMVLTSWLFQMGFTAVVIGLILVFQNDIRRVFERLGGLVGLIDRTLPLTRGTAEVLAQSLAAMAERHVGALVVLVGREPLEPHVHGGKALDGLITAPLLDSLFDPSSDGHDGAVIIAHDRIERFGAHLPLSQNLEQLGSRGTRHAAGLGLTEHTDAMVLIVSEERGALSIAHRGAIEPVGGEAELLARIEAFTRDLGAAEERRTRLSSWVRWLGPALLRRWHLKLLSVVLATGIWLSVVYRVEPVVMQWSVPVEFHNLPATMQIREVYPQTITVTLSGPKQRFALMDMGTLRLAIDVRDVRPGRVLKTFEPRHLNLPATGVSVSDFSPDGVSFTVEKRPEKVAPVK